MEKPDELTQFSSATNAGFDSGLAMTLAALLFSILCTLGVAVVLRRSRLWQVVSEPSLEASVERGEAGIKKMHLKALPASVYSTSSPLGTLDCPICFVEFMEGESVRVLPECRHTFHADCIGAWLISKPSCPSRRQSLLYVGLKKPAEVASPAAEAGESAGMDCRERNEFVTINVVLETFHSSANCTTMTVSSS